MPAASSSPRTALLVEPDPQVGAVLAAALRANGFEATWATSGVVAEQLLGSGSYDLAVVDPLLPLLESARVLRALRANPAASLVVVARAEDSLGKVTVGDLLLDRAAHRCWLGGQEMVLRPKEFDLLAVLALNCDRLVPRRDLIREVWDEHWSGSTKTLDVTMAGLRRCLRTAAVRSDAALTPQIATVRGRGYRLESSTSSA